MTGALTARHPDDDARPIEIERLGVGVLRWRGECQLFRQRLSADVVVPLPHDGLDRARASGITAARQLDGRPEIHGGDTVSLAHAGEWTLAVSGDGPLGCDLEPVEERAADVWYNLLGRDRFALAEVIAICTERRDR